jgi:hypothetical protein
MPVSATTGSDPMNNGVIEDLVADDETVHDQMMAMNLPAHGSVSDGCPKTLMK